MVISGWDCHYKKLCIIKREGEREEKEEKGGGGLVDGKDKLSRGRIFVVKIIANTVLWDIDKCVLFFSELLIVAIALCCLSLCFLDVAKSLFPPFQRFFCHYF